MAERTVSLKPKEIEWLADRLMSRGKSHMIDVAPSMASDLRLAARVIWLLVNKLEDWDQPVEIDLD
jgi:hypothetical protein